MKNILLLVSCLIFVSNVHAQSSTYTVTSEIKNMTTDTYSMTIWGRGKSESKGQQRMVNGQINFSDTTSVPLMIRITPKEEKLVKRASSGGYYPVKSQSIWLIAMPGSVIHLKGHLSDFSEVYPEGNRENEILSELTGAYFPLLNESVNITIDLNKKDNGLIEQEVASKKEAQKQLDEKAKKVLISFLEKYPSSIAGLYFLENTYIRKGIDINLVGQLLGKVSPSYHDYQFYTTIKTRVEAGKYQVGNQILEIRSNRTPDGSEFTTNLWKGKFYLIDFWGSWCMPCISDFPNVKALKKELKDQVKILGIASDQEEKWRPAIESYELNWQHILIGEGDQNFAALLDVRGYPTKILVDPNGKILYKSSGSGEESFKKIRGLIKNWRE